MHCKLEPMVTLMILGYKRILLETENFRISAGEKAQKVKAPDMYSGLIENGPYRFPYLNSE